mmetsp:Transcript_14482/g.48537  ORF Transcript_14482/g.48537 Transcript_14482/m.48537 type:complete len:366 (-) Transcript_14482:2152-3249(-)
MAPLAELCRGPISLPLFKNARASPRLSQSRRERALRHLHRGDDPALLFHALHRRAALGPKGGSDAHLRLSGRRLQRHLLHRMRHQGRRDWVRFQRTRVVLAQLVELVGLYDRGRFGGLVRLSGRSDGAQSAQGGPSDPPFANALPIPRIEGRPFESDPGHSRRGERDHGLHPLLFHLCDHGRRILQGDHGRLRHGQFPPRLDLIAAVHRRPGPSPKGGQVGAVRRTDALDQEPVHLLLRLRRCFHQPQGLLQPKDQRRLGLRRAQGGHAAQGAASALFPLYHSPKKRADGGQVGAKGAKRRPRPLPRDFKVLCGEASLRRCGAPGLQGLAFEPRQHRLLRPDVQGHVRLPPQRRVGLEKPALHEL